MNDLSSEFLDILTQVRTHLELQRVLGVSVISTEPLQKSLAPAAPAPVAAKPEAAVRSPGQTAIPALKPGLEGVLETVRICKGCGLGRGRPVFGEGNPEASLVFVGLAPGPEEERKGKPFADAAGNLLTDIIVKGMKLRREEVYVCTLLKCMLPDNRAPEPAEAEACERFLVNQLKAVNPRIIVALGGIVTGLLLKTDADFTRLRGTWQNYQGILLMPTLDPAHLLQNPDDKKLAWEDIKKVLAEMKKPVVDGKQ